MTMKTIRIPDFIEFNGKYMELIYRTRNVAVYSVSDDEMPNLFLVVLVCKTCSLVDGDLSLIELTVLLNHRENETFWTFITKDEAYHCLLRAAIKYEHAQLLLPFSQFKTNINER